MSKRSMGAPKGLKSWGSNPPTSLPTPIAPEPWAIQMGYVVEASGFITVHEIRLLWEISDTAKVFIHRSYNRMKGHGQESKAVIDDLEQTLRGLVLARKGQVSMVESELARPVAEVVLSLPPELRVSLVEIDQLRRLALTIEAWLARVDRYTATGQGKADRDLFYASMAQQTAILGTLRDRRDRELALLPARVTTAAPSRCGA